MITRNRIICSERQAALIWQQMVSRRLLSTEGLPITVIYPGRINGDNGPDFRDVVIRSQSSITKGDVEIHVKSSDWYAHEHHADADYNNVILHVVMWHDCSSATLLQNGKLIPIVSLATELRHQPYLLPQELPCFQILHHIDRQTLVERLIAAGDARLRQKATQFRVEMLCIAQKEGAGQVLFRGLMRALGYARNTKPFEDLADRMPLNFIESNKGLIAKQALLLGAAGLLPFQRMGGKFVGQLVTSRLMETQVEELEQTWQSVGKEVKTMRENDWHLSRIYPNNSPVRRIIAQSYLLERYSKERLLPAIVRLVKEVPLQKGPRVLRNGLTVAADGYWRNHFDFCLTSRTTASALLGNGKAGEIAVNVVLPFAFSWAGIVNDPQLMDKVMGLYISHPKLAQKDRKSVV